MMLGSPNLLNAHQDSEFNGSALVKYEHKDGVMTVSSPPRAFKAHYDENRHQITMRPVESVIGTSLATPIGQDVDVQCTYDQDNTLDQYLEDLREANKQADFSRLQMNLFKNVIGPVIGEDFNQQDLLKHDEEQQQPIEPMEQPEEKLQNQAVGNQPKTKKLTPAQAEITNTASSKP